MWFLFKENKEGKSEPKEEVVECKECSHLVRKAVASAVIYEHYHEQDFGCDKIIKWYCPDHKKNYTKQVVDDDLLRSESYIRYYIPCEPWQQVDLKGNPINKTNKK